MLKNNYNIKACLWLFERNGSKNEKINSNNGNISNNFCRNVNKQKY